MEPITVMALITAGIPFVTSIFKKLIGTKHLNKMGKKGVNALIPILIGIASTGLYAFDQGNSWVTSLAIGLGSGGAASSIRDIDKNLLRFVESVMGLLQKKK